MPVAADPFVATTGLNWTERYLDRTVGIAHQQVVAGIGGRISQSRIGRQRVVEECGRAVLAES